MTSGRNAYNVRELTGAFGDLGTFIPFLVGYLTVSKMDPVGVLVAFTAGIAMWNMGAGYLAGLLLHHATRRGVVRL